MQSEGAETETIKYNVLKFGNFYQISKDAADLYLIVGTKTAGKSLTIDLMTDKLIKNMKTKEGIPFLAEQSNFDCKYDPIYFQPFKQGKNKVIFLQGFTLDENMEPSTLNKLKQIYARQAITTVKKVSIIIVIDEQERSKLGSLIPHFLDCLGLLQQKYEKQVAALSSNCYLLLSKTEDDVIESLKEEKDDIISQISNKNAINLLTHLFEDNDGNRIQQFHSKADKLSEKGKNLRKIFEPRPLDPKLLSYFKNEQQHLRDIITQKQEEKQIMAIFVEFGSMYQQFLKYITNTSTQDQYMKTISKFFIQEEFLQNLNYEQVKVRWWDAENIEKKLVKYSELKYKMDKKVLKEVLEAFHVITSGIADIVSDKPGYEELRGLTTLFLSLFAWIKSDQWDQKLLTSLQNCIKTIKDSIPKDQFPKKQDSAPVLKSNIEKKSGMKRKTPFTQFKTEIQNCLNNKEVVEICLNFIKQKEKSDKYQWSEAIYPLKMLRDLLGQFQNSNKTNKTLFAQEILTLYLYNDSYFEFQRLLLKYLRDKALSIDFAIELIQELDDLKRYESEIKVIQYVIGNSYRDEDYQVMNQLKTRAILKRHEEYMKYSVTADIQTSKRKLTLKITPEQLLKKAQTMKVGKGLEQALLHFLQSNSFKKYYESK